MALPPVKPATSLIARKRFQARNSTRPPSVSGLVPERAYIILSSQKGIGVVRERHWGSACGLAELGSTNRSSARLRRILTTSTV